MHARDGLNGGSAMPTTELQALSRPVAWSMTTRSMRLLPADGAVMVPVTWHIFTSTFVVRVALADITREAVPAPLETVTPSGMPEAAPMTPSPPETVVAPMIAMPLLIPVIGPVSVSAELPLTVLPVVHAPTSLSVVPLKTWPGSTVIFMTFWAGRGQGAKRAAERCMTALLASILRLLNLALQVELVLSQPGNILKVSPAAGALGKGEISEATLGAQRISLDCPRDPIVRTACESDAPQIEVAGGLRERRPDGVGSRAGEQCSCRGEAGLD
jgi:hypothetical protein